MFRRASEKPNNVRYYTSLRNALQEDKLEKHNIVISEWKLAVLGLVLSLSILAAKIVFAYRDGLYNAIFEKRLVTYETLVTDGEVMFRHGWTTVLKYSSIWFPVLCGALATWFTWLMVFLDSSVPGIQPPSPLSPARYKLRSGHTFHLNYIFAVLVGLMVFVYMYVRGAALQV